MTDVTQTDEAPISTESGPAVHTMENLLAENAELRARIRWLSDRLVEQDKHILRMIDRLKVEISRG